MCSSDWEVVHRHGSDCVKIILLPLFGEVLNLEGAGEVLNLLIYWGGLLIKALHITRNWHQKEPWQLWQLQFSNVIHSQQYHTHTHTYKHTHTHTHTNTHTHFEPRYHVIARNQSIPTTHQAAGQRPIWMSPQMEYPSWIVGNLKRPQVGTLVRPLYCSWN